MLTTELLDVLFWQDAAVLYRFARELEARHFPPGCVTPVDEAGYEAAWDAFLRTHIPGREAFLARVEHYAARGTTDGAHPSVAYMRRMGRGGMDKALRNGTAAQGAARCGKAEQMARGWASAHLAAYADAVNRRDGDRVLELGTGAGLGTWAVMKGLPPVGRLFSVDIDPAAAANADGMARHLGLEGRAAGICAGFWRLPFEAGVFDTVCTHYGLDECREVPAVLVEAARVLRSGGRLVAVARENPWDRQRRWLERWGIGEEEASSLLRQMRLYGGWEALVGAARDAGFTPVSAVVYVPGQGHRRRLGVFERA